MTAVPSPEKLFETLVVCAEDVIVSSDLEGRITFINDAGRRLYGGDHDAGLDGTSAFDLLAPESRENAMDGLRTVLAQGMVRDREYVLVRADGTHVPIEMTVSLLRGDDGTPAGFVSVCRDVSARKRGEARSGLLLEIARMLASQVDQREAVDYLQRRAAEVLGCDAVVTVLRDEGGSVFQLVGQHNASAGALPDFGRVEFRRDEPEVRRLRDRRVMVIDSTRGRDDVPAEWLDRFGLTSVLWAQLIVRGEPLGGLAALSTRPAYVVENWQVDLLEGVAQQLALYLEAQELYRRKEREAEVAQALAHASQELMAALDGEALVDRLCALATQVLECDTCHALGRDVSSEFFRMTGSHGYTIEQREAFEAVQIPPSLLEETRARVEREQVIDMDVGDRASAHPLAQAAFDLGLQRSLCIALCRGRETVGLLVACRRDGSRAFSPEHVRIARGLGQVASIALQYRTALDDLASANRLKSDFVAAISHELRTPLNIIMGYTSLLLEGAFGALPSEQGDAVDRIDRSAGNLFELITEMLDLSRLESGRVRLDVRTVDVARLVQEVETEARELRRPGVAWECRVDSEPIVRTDPLKLKVVVKNLITNAFKFTDAGRVTVTVEKAGTGVRIAVADTGSGIAPESQSLIFEAFRQAAKPDHSRGGVGLGLYIVRRLLEILGGEIEVTSEVGKGTEFRVTLPGQE